MRQESLLGLVRYLIGCIYQLIHGHIVLEPTPEIKEVFPHPFHLAYVVTLTPHQLSTDLHVTNSGDQPLTYQALLHTYFEADAASCTVSPLGGLTYIDKTKNYIETIETRVCHCSRLFWCIIYRSYCPLGCCRS